MAKKRSSASSKGKRSGSVKQKKGIKGSKSNAQNFKRKKAKSNKSEEFDEVRVLITDWNISRVGKYNMLQDRRQRRLSSVIFRIKMSVRVFKKALWNFKLVNHDQRKA